MKIQIIRIEVYDNVFSLKEKINHAKAARVILTDDLNSPVLQNLKMAKLIKRCANNAGKELGIVTRDPNAALILRELQVNVFSDLVSAQQYRWEFDSWRNSEKFPPITSRSRFINPVEGKKQVPQWIRYASFGLAILAVFILALIFIPGADITLHAPLETQQIQIPAVVLKEIDPRLSKPLVLQPVSVVTEAFQTIQTTGTKLVPTGKAQGEIEFTNITPDPIQIPEGMILLSTMDLSKEYITTGSGELPGGPNGKLTLAVESALPGTQGNAERGEVTTVQGSFGLKVSVTNPNAITGGTDVEQSYPSAEDINQLRVLVTNSLKVSALEEIKKTVNKDLIIIPQTLEVTEILSDEYFPTEYSSTDHLSLTLKANVTIFAITKDQVAAYSKPYLDALLPVNYSGESDIEIEDLKVEKINSDGSVKVMLSVKRNARRNIDPNEVTKLISGKSTRDAMQLLSRHYQLQIPAVIAEQPGWLKFLPFLPFRIRVVTVG